MEGFTKTEGGGFIIDTPEAIDMFRLLTLRRGLKFEIDTGMRMTRVPLFPVAKQYGFEGRTKKQAYKYIDDVITAMTAADDAEAMP